MTIEEEKSNEPLTQEILSSLYSQNSYYVEDDEDQDCNESKLQQSNKSNMMSPNQSHLLSPVNRSKLGSPKPSSNLLSPQNRSNVLSSNSNKTKSPATNKNIDL
jgi:hypothetical protein